MRPRSFHMIRQWMRTALLLVALVTPATAPAAPPRQAAFAAAKQECTVYITRTGKRYHRSDCRYLRYGALAVKRSEAIRFGLTACRVCGGSDCE